MLAKIDVLQSLGIDLQSIMNGDTTAFDKISEGIQNIQIAYQKLDSDKELIENQIDNINDLVDAFDKGAKTFEECQKYLDGANDSFDKIKSNASKNVPSIIEATGGINAKITDIISNSKTLAKEYDAAITSVKGSTEGTTGVAQSLYKLSDNLNSVRIQLDKINPIAGATSEQMQSIYESIKATGETFNTLSQNYLKDANDMFGKLKDDSVPNSIIALTNMGTYITDSLSPDIKDLFDNIKTLTDTYKKDTTEVNANRKETQGLDSDVNSLSSSLTSLQAQNLSTASTYREMASAAYEAAAASREAAEAAKAAAKAASEQAEAEEKASKSSKSNSKSSIAGVIAGTIAGAAIGTIFHGFSSGTKNAKKQTAIVGEKEPEIVWHKKDNSYQLATDTSAVKLDSGDVVFNGKETKGILDGKNLSSDIGQIKGIQTKMLSGLSAAPKTKATVAPATGETTIHVDKLELPNVRTGDDAEKIVTALCNLDGTVTQKLYSKK